jgi:hypothetical protein
MARNRVALKGAVAKARKAPRPNGYVLYEGPAMSNPKVEIVVIATGLRTKSANGKTGAVVQTWILVKDVNPMAALATGQDSVICGGCRHRPKVTNKVKRSKGQEYLTFAGRTCYVDVRPLQTIYKAYQRGIYPKLATSQIADVLADRIVRLGSYGDPAAVPLIVWQMAVSKAASHTGYTHQWKSERLRGVTALCQASVDTPEEADKAKALGLGYFRVKAPSEPTLDGEIVCPASAEAGKVTTCAECRMCDGRGKTIVIDVHGIGASNFAPKTSRNLPVV